VLGEDDSGCCSEAGWLVEMEGSYHTSRTSNSFSFTIEELFHVSVTINSVPFSSMIVACSLEAIAM